MPHTLDSLPERGTKVGLAFSGGLDTRAATAWMSQNGIHVHAYTADLGQPDEKNPEDIPPIAKQHGATEAKLLDCREDLAREGLIAIQCGAFNVTTGLHKYMNTTPLGRVVTAQAIVRDMVRDAVHIFSDGSTHKGNDTQRFFRYALMEDPGVQIYKPWNDQAFVSAFGGRSEMSEFLDSLGLPYKMGAEKAYSTDVNMLGATHEAKDLEHLDVGMDIVEPLMGVNPAHEAVPIEPENVEIRFENGVPVALNGETFGSLHELIAKANEIGGRHGLGMSDQIENRVIEAKSRGIYEAPGMTLLHTVYERLMTAIHNQNTIDLYHSHGRQLGRLLYEGRWKDPEAELIKQGLTQWVAPTITGTVTLRLRRGNDYSIVNTISVNATYHPDELTMESGTGAFTPGDRNGALQMQSLGIDHNREVIARTLATR